MRQRSAKNTLSDKGEVKGCVDLTDKDDSLLDEVNRLSGENIGLCLHCRCCANGCPYTEVMDYPPHVVFRLVQLGLREEALACSTIWICVSCNTCSIQCPVALDIPAVMDGLRYVALSDDARLGEPEIVKFHREVVQSIRRHGRTHKLEIMLNYKIRTRKWFEDMDLGLKMLAKRKLDLRPSRIKGIEGGSWSRIFEGKGGNHGIWRRDS